VWVCLVKKIDSVCNASRLILRLSVDSIGRFHLCYGLGAQASPGVSVEELRGAE
jgi:hypothetical protein